MCSCPCHIFAMSKFTYLICTGCHLFALLCILVTALSSQLSSAETHIAIVFIVIHFLAFVDCILIVLQIQKSNLNHFFNKMYSCFIFYFYSIIIIVFLVLCIYLSLNLDFTFVILCMLVPSIICFVIILVNIVYFIFLVKKRDRNLCNICLIHCNNNHKPSFPDNPPSYELFKPPSYEYVCMYDKNFQFKPHVKKVDETQLCNQINSS